MRALPAIHRSAAEAYKMCTACNARGGSGTRGAPLSFSMHGAYRNSPRMMEHKPPTPTSAAVCEKGPTAVAAETGWGQFEAELIAEYV